ncbi:DUF6918 family protein [Paractinoplanes hotanensis]|jgi:hypothetical protein|uniref:DUF2059 domain-containing protein n=1 Tax=Paractinoplanes hotanensis TaxID=2906497 RepID=A0ABT0YEM9_9ACTN|nr:hypothetical protein [Actinoplanes hotanensis]MCM4084502.1 hypothetical protein [Actinoplanes hotanensis]
MVLNLLELSDNPATKAAIVKDAQALVEAELAGKSGISAGAVKLAYKAVTSFAPGYYEETLNIMVPSMLEQLQPFWTDFRAAGGGTFGEYLAKRQDEVTPAMLLVTDDMANASEKAVVVKAYKTVRGGASKHIEAALPALGGLVEKYAA